MNGSGDSKSIADNQADTYKEAYLYSRSIYDNFFKLAAMSFTFNALLLTSLFLLFDKIPDHLAIARPYFVMVISIFGIVYNLGARGAYIAAMESWKAIREMLDAYEEEIDGARIQSAFPGFSKNNLISVESLTRAFFTMWIVGWFLMLGFSIIFRELIILNESK